MHPKHAKKCFKSILFTWLLTPVIVMSNQNTSQLRRYAATHFRKTKPLNHQNRETLNSLQESSNNIGNAAKQHTIMENFILLKIQQYTEKSHIWQFIHSRTVKQRIINKSIAFANTHGIPEEFVRDTVEQVFNRIDRQTSKFHQIIDKFSRMTNSSTYSTKDFSSSHNRWRTIQLQRARQLFSNLDASSSDEEFLSHHLKHVFETLTPKRQSGENEQFLDEPIDLDAAHEQAVNTAKIHLNTFFNKAKLRRQPDITLIQEMIKHGLADMQSTPSIENFQQEHSFLSKISLLFNTFRSYNSGIQNMSDDFMILRFGHIFGPQTSTVLTETNRQFAYLVHLFLQSVVHLMTMFEPTLNDYEDALGSISSLLFEIESMVINSPVVKLEQNSIFSPISNVDCWTWLLEKWRDALRSLPMFLTKAGAFVRLVRTTIGIALVRLYNLSEIMVETRKPIEAVEIDNEIFQALQLGFYFGVAYSLVDCGIDEIENIDKRMLSFFMKSDDSSKNISDHVNRWLLLMEKALSGAGLDRKQLPATPLTSMLLETYDSMIVLSRPMPNMKDIFKELALLLRSQRLDKKCLGEFYEDTELYLGPMLKSHFTYMCAASLGNVQSARQSEATWLVPLFGQLNDDCRDFHDDFISKSMTPFTHYVSVSNNRTHIENKQMSNPFYNFLYLCCDIYESSMRHRKTGAFFGRRILRTLKSIEVSHGISALREFLYLFCRSNIELNNYCFHNLRCSFPLVNDPDKSVFRLVGKYSINYARTNQKLEIYFAEHLSEIESSLKIDSVSRIGCMQEEKLLLSAMNYSVNAGGKRIRPLLLFMAAELYGLEAKKTISLARALEYLHTSSLILDDLPAQDNSDLRRGRPTLHKATDNGEITEDLSEGRAQLAAIDLIAISLSLVNTNLTAEGFSAEKVIELIGEISMSMHELCVGQMMDLRAARMGFGDTADHLEHLDCIAWLKTGKAIEIGLISPTILALSKSSDRDDQIKRIRELSRLLGILFQMRDDLLDVDGEDIGKPIELDVKNKTVTYVSTLGVEKTRDRLNEYRHQAMNLVDQSWSNGAGTLKDLINYIVDRKK